MRFLLFVVMFVYANATLGITQSHSASQHQHSASDNDPFTQSEVEYVCPMHSQIVKDAPGSCPICGMDLVERQVDTGADPAHDQHSEQQHQVPTDANFSVARNQQRAMRVVTAEAQRMDLQPRLNAQAQVSWQESAKYHVHSRAEGWVEELYADVEGQWVDKGDKLYRVYAPELVVAQDDYLQLLNSLNEIGNEQRQQQFKQRGQQRLRLLGMSEVQIAELERTRMTAYEVDYFAPQSGYLTELNIQQGMYVNPGLELMTITGDQQLWLLLDIPTRYADQVAVGQMVHFSSDQLDGHWMNRIDYLYPQVDPSTQTLTARVPINQSIGNLREGLWVTGEVELAAVDNALVIPVKSLIQTEQNNRVIVQTGPQNFAVRAVKTGLRVGDQIEILSGLAAGEQVVTNGQFLLDSEASLRGLQPEGNSPLPMSHDHGGH